LAKAGEVTNLAKVGQFVFSIVRLSLLGTYANGAKSIKRMKPSRKGNLFVPSQKTREQEKKMARLCGA